MTCCMKSKFKQCCCKCVNHRPAHRHCGASGKCTCNVRIGWTCCLPSDISEQVFIDWPEHSCGCELFENKEER